MNTTTSISLVKVKHIINLHKGTTLLVVLSMMAYYNNYEIAPLIYLALHGTYGILWLMKDRIFPDRQWEQELPLVSGIITFVILALYWVAPFLLISQHITPPAIIIAIAVSMNILGVFAHYASDAQKYYTLKYHTGLITEGFFARCRNTNYLGEILIYFSFALLSMHWLSFLIVGIFIALLFVPNMLRKDKSLSRYPEFATYQENSGLIFPVLWKSNPSRP